MAPRGEKVLRLTRTVLALGTVVCVLLTLLRFVDNDRVVLLGLVAVAPALAALGLLLFALTFGARVFLPTAALVLVAAALAMPGRVLPRTGCESTYESGAGAVVLSHNAMVGNDAADAVAAQVLAVGPDLVVLQEATEDFVLTLETELAELYPHRESLGLQSLFSRWPLSDVTSTGTATGGALIATMAGPNGSLRVANFHASAPSNADRRANQREEYASMRNWRKAESVDLVIGDFNASAAQRLYRGVVGDGFVDAHRRAGCGFGLTWGWEGTFAMLSLDHALVAEEYSVTRFDILDRAGSDHKALVVELGFPAAAN